MSFDYQYYFIYRLPTGATVPFEITRETYSDLVKVYNETKTRVISKIWFGTVDGELVCVSVDPGAGMSYSLRYVTKRTREYLQAEVNSITSGEKLEVPNSLNFRST